MYVSAPLLMSLVGGLCFVIGFYLGSPSEGKKKETLADKLRKGRTK